MRQSYFRELRRGRSQCSGESRARNRLLPQSPAPARAQPAEQGVVTAP